jgi:Cu2+-exporting ATPase
VAGLVGARTIGGPTTSNCRHCDLPCAGGADFCCYGCELVHGLTEGAREEGTSARANVAICAFFAMNLMAVTLILYTDDLYGPQFGASMAALRTLFRWASALFATPILLILGLPMLARARAWRADASARLDALVSIAAFSAFALSWGSLLSGGDRVYFEVAAMTLIFVAAGRAAEAFARARASEAVGAAMRPQRGRCERSEADGSWQAVTAGEIAVGDRLRVPAGAAVPVDAELLDARVLVDRSAVTGESAALELRSGQQVLAGDVLVGTPALLCALADSAHSSRAALERLTRRAFEERSRSEDLGQRAAGLLVPLMLAIALLTVCGWALAGDPARGVLAALAVLVCACPCALGIATPLAIRAALARASTRGVLITSGRALERLADVAAVAFDKTGTLTRPQLEVGRTRFAQPGAEVVMGWVAALESGVVHPIADVLTAHARNVDARPAAAEQVRVEPGVGVRGRVDGREIFVGRASSASDVGDASTSADDASIIVLADGRPVARLELVEALRPGARAAVGGLSDMGLSVSLLSGDAPAKVERVAAALGVPWEGGLLPDQKLARITAMQSSGGCVMMVGDGTNDAPALAGAALGAVVSQASDLARAVAPICVREDDLAALPWAVGLANATVAVIRRNLAWTLAYNAVCVTAAASGHLPPVLAAIAMAASSLTVTANSARLLRHPLGTPSGIAAAAAGTRVGLADAISLEGLRA